jgi:predicted DsbA family dithiol-disulfide isomerase
MAIESERVTADLIEANEFMDMSQQYRVSGVPKIVVNDRIEFVGALPEPRFLEAVLRAVPSASDPNDAAGDDDGD